MIITMTTHPLASPIESDVAFDTCVKKEKDDNDDDAVMMM